jgi:O-antigen/teichoic acid export membrane protein
VTRHRGLTAIVRSALSRHLTIDAPFWVLMDQILVSGVNFTTNVLLARCLGLPTYGTFVSLYALSLYAWSWQFALFVTPAMSIAPRMPADETRERYLRGVNTLQLAFAALVSLVIVAVGAIGGVVYGWIDHRVLSAWLWATVSFLVQDGLRRYYFVSERSRNAFINDLVSCGGQLALLIVLAATGRLTIVTALGALAASYTAAIVAGGLAERLLVGLREALHGWRDSWRMGRDLCVSLQLHWANNNGLLLLGAGFIGPQAAGAVRAVQTLVGPLNVILQAMDNVIPVRAARRHNADRIAGLNDYLGRLARRGGALLAAGSILIAMFGGSAIRFVYGGQLADSLSGLLTWSLAYVCLAFFLRLTIYRDRTLGDTQNVVRTALVVSVTSLVTMPLLVRPLQELAIPASMVAGQSMALIYAHMWNRTSQPLPSHRATEGNVR